jgi:hypothetical protein
MADAPVPRAKPRGRGGHRVSDERVELSEGQKAPEIDAPITGGDGDRFHLSGQRGRWVVVYFYPRANTPG